MMGGVHGRGPELDQVDQATRLVGPVENQGRGRVHGSIAGVE